MAQRFVSEVQLTRQGDSCGSRTILESKRAGQSDVHPIHALPCKCGHTVGVFDPSPNNVWRGKVKDRPLFISNTPSVGSQIIPNMWRHPLTSTMTFEVCLKCGGWDQIWMLYESRAPRIAYFLKQAAHVDGTKEHCSGSNVMLVQVTSQQLQVFRGSIPVFLFHHRFFGYRPGSARWFLRWNIYATSPLLADRTKASLMCSFEQITVRPMHMAGMMIPQHFASV